MTVALATPGRGGRREQQRAHTLREIRATARVQLAEVGAAGLTLSAVARRAGLSQSGMYRYYANLDALLTDLVADGYTSLAIAVEAAVDRDGEPLEQARAVGLTYRSWAVDDPVGFALIFGSPVPSYRAPAEGPTVDPAARVGTVIVNVLLRAHARGHLRPLATGVGAPTAREAARSAVVRPGRLDDLPEVVRDRFLDAWSRLHGWVCLEVFGHLDTYVTDPEAAFTRLLDALLVELGLDAARRPSVD